LLSVGAIVTAEAFVVGLVIKPPLLGWIGFAIVAVIALILAALTPIAFELMRVSPQRPAEPGDREERLLVVADPLCSEALLSEAIAAYREHALVHVVVPLHVSALHFLTNDESAETELAEETLSLTLGLLRLRGVQASGSVGSDKPLESMTDALGKFAATRILLATPPDSDSFWLERGLFEKARQLTPLPVEHMSVATATVAEELAAR
jgi:GABA permease